jgi:hypothetical protein
MCVCPEPPIQYGLEIFLPDRFGDIVIHSRGKTTFAISLHGIGGHGDNGCMA